MTLQASLLSDLLITPSRSLSGPLNGKIRMRLHFSMLVWQRLESNIPLSFIFANKNNKNFKKEDQVTL
jgi:hypothetical protein